MHIDAPTFALCLALSALLASGMAASLARISPSTSEALWHWCYGMACAFAGMILLVVSLLGSRPPGIASLSLACMACFFASDATSIFHGRRLGKTRIGLLCFAFAAIGVLSAYPGAEVWRSASCMAYCAWTLGSCSMTFASELRRKPSRGAPLAMGSLGAAAFSCFAVGALAIAGEPPESSGAVLTLFGAGWMGSAFGFMLAASELERSKVQELSMRDGLTGLLTKKAFYEIAPAILADCARNGKPCSAIMVDIDYFKRINDSRGHLAGDSAIVHASSLIARSLRASDVCARFGGEEFCLLLPGTSSSGAMAVAERILESARVEPAIHVDPVTGKVERISFTVSSGVVSALPEPGGTMAQLLERADQALYASKGSGRDKATLAKGSLLYEDAP